MLSGVGRSPTKKSDDAGNGWGLLDETVLAMILARAPLPAILGALCTEIEKQHDGLMCSVLLLDADGMSLRTVAAPSLPDEYCRAIDGVKIGPAVGSCGTALYRGEQVVVSDIASDPLWAEGRALALPHGLRACWSTPIAVENGGNVGTFAIYYREPRVPAPEHLQLIAHATRLAGIAIQHDRAQAQLRVAEDRYRTLVERLPAITYIACLGEDGAWHYVSPQIESMLGYSPKEWLSDSMNWMNRIHLDDRPIALAAERRFQKTHELFYAEYRMYARDGRVVWFRDEAVMLQETEEHGLVMQGVLYDITAHKRLEEELRQSQKMEAVGQLAGGVAHDFNNLLMLIQAHNERLMGRLALGDPARQDAVEIEHAVTRAAALTRQLLAFGRKQILHVKVMNLNAVLAEVMKMLDRVIPKNIELTAVEHPALGRVKGDPGQIEQVVLNLAVNARDAMPNGGQLVLKTSNVEVLENYAPDRNSVPAGQYVVLAVRDTGTGMDLETQNHIFEPFFTTKEAGKGTGLGLATVYGVVKQMGGTIQVHSRPGEGTIFEIYLPRVEEMETVVATELRSALAASPTGTETVLLVEDQDGIRDLVREFLERKGYSVLCAMDGQDALCIAGAHENPIDLLLTDVIMPNLGGRELAPRLQQTHPEMKVLFMSGCAEQETRSRGIGASAPVLEKPFLLETLAGKIREVLDGGGAR